MSEGPLQRQRSPAARLAAAGLDPQRALTLLSGAGLWDEGDPSPLERLGDIITPLSLAADPADALHAIAAIAENHRDVFDQMRADEDWLGRFVAVSGTSRPLGDLLGRFPDAARSLRAPRPIAAARIAREVEAATRASTDRDVQGAAIAAIRRQATAGIAARDLTLAVDVEAVSAELAALAEGVLMGALAGLHAEVSGGEPRATIAVIGMGKLGGVELNYVSDVDVIFVHAATEDPDQPPSDATKARDQAAAEEARKVLEQLLALLNATTTMGRAYEIDPTLRPEGRNGPLSRTVESFNAYWQRWAKTWEFQAMLKARPVAGDRDLGARLLAHAEPFVYPDELDPAVVAEIRDMKSRVEAKPEVTRHGDRQVKLGPGGIRDIEFAVQLLQLVHGRADRSLRLPGTLPSLRALANGGYVAEEDAETFSQAYRSLRNVEHRLQLAHERRTHTIPDDDERQEWLARALGYRPGSHAPAREDFLTDLRRVQRDVRDLHAKLFYRPLLEVHAAVSASAAGVALPHEVRAMGQKAAYERLEVLGFHDGRGALRDLRALTSGTTRRAATLRAILPAMLSALSASADADTGLRMFRTLVDTQGRDSKMVSMLRDHPPVAQHLAEVLGTSEVAGELLVDRPQGIEWLLGDEIARTARDRETLVRLARARLGWQDRNAALRRFKRHELLRLVLRDVLGYAIVSTVGEELTALGEACLDGALHAELGAAAATEDAPARIAIIGLGKLGGRELHYASDLDVMFVHEPTAGADETAASAFAVRVAEEVMRSLGQITAEGTAFEVDPDLRPEGASGPLSRSLASCKAYYARWSQPWEHQALLKARVVAGDEDLGRRFVTFAQSLAYPEDFSDRDAIAMRKMKARIERERIPKRADAKRHIKLGPGGLSDVEWTVQLIQQQHGAREPHVRVTSTMAALDAAQDASLIAHRDAMWLREGYRFLSTVRNRLYLLRQRNVDMLPVNHALLDHLARSMGYGSGGRQDFEADHLRHLRRVRQVTQRVFYDVEPDRAGRN